MLRLAILLTAIIAVFMSFSAGAQDTTSPAAPSYQNLRYDEELSTYEYPYPVKLYRFRSQGEDLKMAYMYLPAKEQGKPVITLLHGKNFNAAYWKSTAEYLQSQGYGVLMPDQIGFGKSSKEDEYQYSFAALAANTKNLQASLGLEKTILVGHSMGGMLASRFALLYPEAVEKLILLNPIGLENYLQFVEYKDVDFFYENERAKTPEKLIAYQKKNYYDGAWSAEYEALAYPLIGQIQGEDWDDVAKVNALTFDMVFTQPVIEEFKDFKVPVSLIIGTRDRTGPGRGWMKEGVEYELGRYDQLGAHIKARNEAINVIELEGLGHMPQIEDFDRFKAAFETALNQ